MMRWHRGLLRLWVAVSVLWVVVAGGIIYMAEFHDAAAPRETRMSDLDRTTKAFGNADRLAEEAGRRGDEEARQKYAEDAQRLADHIRGLRASTGDAPSSAETTGRLMIFVAVTLIPPIVLLLLGYATAWIVRGFRGDDT